MKNGRKILSSVMVMCVIGIVAVSCDKDQACINKLDGTWNVVDFTTHNVTADTAIVYEESESYSTSSTVTFEKYKTKDASSAAMVYSTSVDQFSPWPDTSYTIVDNYEYSITGKCSEFLIVDPGYWDPTEETQIGYSSTIATITELRRSQFTYTFDEVTWGSTYRHTVTLTKQ